VSDGKSKSWAQRCAQRRSPRDGGTRGFLGFLMGGTCDGEGSPSREAAYHFCTPTDGAFRHRLKRKPRPKVVDRGFPTKGVIAGTITAISIA